MLCVTACSETGYTGKAANTGMLSRSLVYFFHYAVLPCLCLREASHQRADKALVNNNLEWQLLVLI